MFFLSLQNTKIWLYHGFMKVTIVKSEKYGISSPSQVLFEVKKKRKSKTMQPCRRQWSNLEGKITSMCSERVLKHTRTKQEEPFHCTHTYTHSQGGSGYSVQSDFKCPALRATLCHSMAATTMAAGWHLRNLAMASTAAAQRGNTSIKRGLPSWLLCYI